MNADRVLQLIVLACALAVSALSAEDKPGRVTFPQEQTSSDLREGTWEWRSGDHVSWMEYRRVVRLAKSEDRWTICFFTLSHTRESFHDKQAPKTACEGPYPVSVKNGALHIERPEGVVRYSCRFHGELLQFPALVCLDERTFSFTFSEVSPPPEPGKAKVRTWSYTWACDSAPAKEPSGEATLTVASPRGNETIRLTYATKDDHDGPSLVFRTKEAESPKRDRFVWHQRYFGPQIYESISRDLDRPGLQRTYLPAGDALRTLVESALGKPGKVEPQE